MENPLAAGTQPIQRIYRGTGTQVERPLSCVDPDPDLARVPTIADLVPVTEIMSRELICARRDLNVTQLVELMVQHRIGCVPVVEDPGRPVGMITKFDLVEQLLHNNRGDTESPAATDLLPQTANELMMPLALTLGERASVAHVAALMASEDVHHIPIVDDEGRLIGIISTMDIVRWLARNDGFGSILATSTSHRSDR